MAESGLVIAAIQINTLCIDCLGIIDSATECLSNLIIKTTDRMKSVGKWIRNKQTAIGSNKQNKELFAFSDSQQETETEVSAG